MILLKTKGMDERVVGDKDEMAIRVRALLYKMSVTQIETQKRRFNFLIIWHKLCLRPMCYTLLQNKKAIVKI